MSIISKFPGGGGTGIKGIIENYYVYAGSNVSAGDLVEYINGIASQTTETSVDTQLSSMQNSGNAISAVKLDGSRIFIAHMYSPNYSLYGMIVTINDTNITYGADTRLSDTTRSGSAISAIKLDDNRIFIAHSYGKNYHLYGMIVSISGSTITTGDDTELTINTSIDRPGRISAQLLHGGDVFVSYPYGARNYLYGMIVSISGTSVTAGTEVSLSTDPMSGEVISTQLLSNGNVFIAHSYSNYQLYGMIVAIIGSTIRVGERKQLSNITNSGKSISTKLLRDNVIFIAHSWDTYYYLYGMIVDIDGTSIINGTDTILSSIKRSLFKISTELLPNGNIFLTYCNNATGTNDELYGMIVIINNAIITAGIETQLSNVSFSGTETSILSITNELTFVVHSYSGYYNLYAQIFETSKENNIPTSNIDYTVSEQQVRPTTSSKFDGVAKTSGVGGTSTAHNQQISIYTKPKRQNYKLKFTASGDIFSIENTVVTSSLGINGDYNTTQVSLSFNEGKNEIDIPEGSIVTVQNSLFVPSEFILNPSSSYYYRIPRNLPIKRIDATNYTYEFIMPSEYVEWHCFKSSGGTS